MAITTLPTPPQRSDPANFATRADAFLTALPTFGAEANTLQTDVNAKQTTASNAATSATVSAAAALASQILANASANATVWVSGTTYALGANVISLANVRSYRRLVAGAGTTDPSLDTTNWVSSGPGVVRSARTSNTVIAAGDFGTVIDITSGTFTQTFSGVATLGSGWWCYIKNSGTGDITVDPNASELVDGLTSYIMYPGEVRLFLCDGSALYSIIINPYKRTFAASGTWTIPPGYAYHGAMVWSGGASGQRNNNVAAFSAGGAGGGCADVTIPSSFLGTSQTITVGAGGNAVTTVAVGNVGGNSSIGSIFTVFAGLTYLTGGSVNSTYTVNSHYGYEGDASAITAPFKTIWGGSGSSNDGSSTSGNSVYGGAAGGSVAAGGAAQNGGASLLAGHGGAGVSAGNGVAGQAPAGGGGATQTGTQSGAGARGEVRVWGMM